MLGGGKSVIQRPNSTFCWLPPDRLDTEACVLLDVMPSARTISVATTFSLRFQVGWMGRHRGMVRLACRLAPSTKPCFKRSSGTSATPARSARRGDLEGRRLESTETTPDL